MSSNAAFLYGDDYMRYQFGPRHPFQPVREKLTLDTVASLGVFDKCGARVIDPTPVDMRRLNAVHPPEYVRFVERTCAAGGELDRGDTPAVPGLYEGALSVVGGTLRGAKGIMEEEFDHAFNPGGGLHHAHPGRASGFCVFHDIAVAVRALQEEYGLRRIAVVDIDGHHGDGTQEIFYGERVLTISLHRFGRYFFPGSGSTGEIGEGEGEGCNINVPLPSGTDDELYLKAYRAIAVPALRAYRPQLIIHQFGADGHYKDLLVGLGLTTRGYEEIARLTHGLAHELCGGKYLVVGGGGYDIDATRRTWSIMFSILAGANEDVRDMREGLHDHGGPRSGREIEVKVDETIEALGKNSLPLLEEMVRFA